ncbi:GNAT family N-acetyltransferase [Flaviflexus massiliensis]|uniref:GNAT family N-acetyltransferase n=1 Tax=Flaviflexus massiliensis TaxID=1522309 RepID=UPI0006D5562E|nr:DUF4081 domain-containing GNAT family N-acetyltransferase [Flaviflexus massiliensis]
MLWGSSGRKVTRLSGRYRSAVLQHLAQDPVASVLAAVHVDSLGLGSSRMLGIVERGELQNTVWYGANMVPVGTNHADRLLYADFALNRPRECSSIVGNADEVLDLWEMLRDYWSADEVEVRASQPSLVAGELKVQADPSVRPARIEDAPIVAPAAVAMFTEEVGYDPTAYGPGYLSRVYELCRMGHSLIRTGIGPDGNERVEFKADIGALYNGVAQIQGVWTAPDLRGTGIATGAMAAVVEHVRTNIAPTVSLYVNSYNHAALKVYDRVGFHQVGEFATVLL